MKDLAVTIHGVSKTYGLANLRIGWACGAKHFIDKMNFYVSATQVDVAHVIKVMALKALDSPVDYLNQNSAELRERVILIDKLVRRINEKYNHTPFKLEIVYQPESGHSILLDFKSLIGLDCEFDFQIKNSIDITNYFLRNAKVALSPGLSMGFDEPGIMRISFGCIGLSNMYESSLKAEKHF